MLSLIFFISLPNNTYIMELVNNNCENISVNINTDSIFDYKIARVRVYLNCCGDPIFYEIPNISSTLISDNIYINEEGKIIINPSFYEGVIPDGIHTIDIELFKVNGESFKDTGCLFVDCNIKCLVYDALETLETEEERIQLLMEHYTLTVATNCSCECDKLCQVYKAIIAQIPTIEDDCGCM